MCFSLPAKVHKGTNVNALPFFLGDFSYIYICTCVPIIKALLGKLLLDVALTETTVDVLNSKIRYNHQMHKKTSQVDFENCVKGKKN